MAACPLLAEARAAASRSLRRLGRMVRIVKYRIKQKDPTGQYIVTATASANGLTGGGAGCFTMQ